MDKVLAIIMAGGMGERLQPLTRERPSRLFPLGANSAHRFHTEQLHQLRRPPDFRSHTVPVRLIAQAYPGGLGYLELRVRRLHILCAGSAEAGGRLVPWYG